MTNSISGLDRYVEEVSTVSADVDLDQRDSRRSSLISHEESIKMSDSISINEISDQENNNMFPFDLNYYLGNLPINVLSRKNWETLGRRLDCRKALGGDFVDLAWRLFPELSSERMYSIEKKKKPTVYLLECYVKDKAEQATIANLFHIMRSMRRLDVARELLYMAEGHLGRNEKKKGLLTYFKRKFFREDDTVSICSVQSLASVASSHSWTSYASVTSLSSNSYHGNIEFPLKEANHKESNLHEPKKQVVRNSKNLNTENANDKPLVFLVSASDEVENLVRLVKWLRLRGINARSIKTDRHEYEVNPSKYVKQQLELAEFVLIFCSSNLQDILDEKSDQGDTQFLQYVFDYMNREWFTNSKCISKYIPLLGLKTARSVVPMPLCASVVSLFETKEHRKDLLNRLYRQEEYSLPEIGKKPILKQCVISGELMDLRK